MHSRCDLYNVPANCSAWISLEEAFQEVSVLTIAATKRKVCNSIRNIAMRLSNNTNEYILLDILSLYL